MGQLDCRVRRRAQVTSFMAVSYVLMGVCALEWKGNDRHISDKCTMEDISGDFLREAGFYSVVASFDSHLIQFLNKIVR